MKKVYIAFATGLLATSFMSCDPKSAESIESSTAEEQMIGAAEEDQRPSPLERIESEISGKSFSVQYGAPSVKGRVLWGDLVPYNVVWRTGANEATFVELTDDMTVEGQTLPAGKYSLFSIPKENAKWIVIFNSEWNLEHGHFQYDEKNDVLRVEVSPEWEASNQEQLKISIEDPGLVIRWEKMKLPIAIQ